MNQNLSKEYSIPVRHNCKQLLQKHNLYIDKININEYGISICYTITPPLPPIIPGVSNLRTIQWDYSATDDLGNFYIDAGGAYGLSEDKKYTDGVISLAPVPPTNVSHIDFILKPSLKDGDSFECIFRVNLKNI